MKIVDLLAEYRSENESELKKKKDQLLIIQGVRTSFLVATLVISVLFQNSQAHFFSIEVWVPIYALLLWSFAFHSIFLVFYKRMSSKWWAQAFLFALDTFVFTGLIYFTGTNQSIFLFLYLVNIILCGLVYQRRGSFALALWTSTLFSLLLILGPQLQGQNVYFALGLNNFAFFSVAALSGILSEQINFMGAELQLQRKDIESLKGFNELILASMPVGIITVGSDNKVLQVNPSVARILQRTMTSGEELPVPFKNLLEERNAAHQRQDLTYVLGDKDKLILEATTADIQSVEGEFKGRLIIFQDATEVRRLEYQMRQSEKMAAVGQLAAGIAHEIRNPLASISGSIQLLRDGLPPQTTEEEKLMNIVLREIDRLNNLISEFLDFVRPESNDFELVSVNQVIREVLDIVSLHRNLRKGVKQIVDLSGESKIKGRADKLKQAFLNIVINAYQAMEKVDEPVIEVSSKEKDESVVVVFRDHGCGIKQENLRKIFEPFHTTKTNGTGLGLAISHKILEIHGAKIFVESEWGSGTEIVLEFPRAKPFSLIENDMIQDNNSKKRGIG